MGLGPYHCDCFETKTEDASKFTALTGLGFDSWRMVPSSGRSSGIVAWSTSRISVSILEENTQFFHLKCHSASLPLFFISAIYVIPHSNNREILWDNIGRLAKGINGPWSVLGDFNDICSINERIGGRNSNHRRMLRFCEWMNDCGLADLGAIGPRMTWKGPKLPGCARLYERLDRALGNSDLLQHIPDAYLKASTAVEFR
ncbi:hypothetical protein K1719_028561 [Acacia pycnantha]|nr:hypothetical protein K1719_028561 [Acacia pycnantha]